MGILDKKINPTQQQPRTLIFLTYFDQPRTMAKEISEERQKDYRQTFDMFDNNKSGKIDKKELGNVMRQLGKNPSETDLEALVKEVDADGDGEIDFKEFLTMMAESGDGVVGGEGDRCRHRHHDEGSRSERGRQSQ